MSILVVGSLNMDINFRVPEFVKPGQIIAARRMFFSDGGKGSNQATAAGRLGGQVTMLGCVGNDDSGRALTGHLAADGIDVSCIKVTDEAPTGTAMIEVEDSGQNRIIVSRGSNDLCTPDYIHAHADLIKNADYIVLQQEIPLETIYAVLETAHEGGAKVILNPAPFNPDFDPTYYQFVDYLTPNETELDGLVQKDLSREEKMWYMAGLGVDNVVVTVGEEGCLILSDGVLTRVPAFRVKAVDTVGAGDCFNGAMAVKLDEGATLEEACLFAAAASAISVTRASARDSMPQRPETDAFLQQHK